MTGRFAPTPSGRMHIGNVYAMLGAWLSARKSGDSIRLRIEDIDEPRVVPGAAETMMRDLEWLGLDVLVVLAPLGLQLQDQDLKAVQFQQALH